MSSHFHFLQTHSVMMMRLALFLLAAPLVASHRSLPSGITCGNQFYAPDVALTIPNPKVSWATYRILTCDAPVFWLEAQADAGQDLAMTLLTPVLERFSNVRMTAAIIGPGLQSTIGLNDNLPAGVLESLYSDAQFGIQLFKCPQDQTTCDHLQSEVMGNASNVVDSRCVFYEPFGGSNSWVLLDDTFTAPMTAMYKIAVYEESGLVAKASFACCDWPEDFVTNYAIPEPNCTYCGTSSKENPAWSSLFYEQKSMAQYGGFPGAGSCSEDSALAFQPSAEQCPPVLEDVDGTAQPASCVLGCSSNGECHSHNVFGECTYELEWSLVPKFGDAQVSKVILFKGDKVKFKYTEDTGSAHNLFKLANAEAMEQCNFSNASAVANVEEIRIGSIVTMDQAGEFYFTCGIGCTNFPDDNSTAVSNEQRPLSDSCHCVVGQKVIVEVKDSSDGLRCHDHPQVSPSGADPPPLACLDGAVPARTINNPSYGAMDETQCAEFCVSPVAVNFLTSVDLGICLDVGFSIGVSEQTVKPPGSPVDVEVTIKRKEPESSCHCHSYEQIKCPEEETAADTLYIEHIQEIEDYCGGILDGRAGSEDCPYQCFQPFEVLHLHYLECKTRPYDPAYLAVNATEKCHLAAAAPNGTDCPVVSLGEGVSDAAAKPQDDSSSGSSKLSAVLGMLLLPIFAAIM